MYEKLAGMTGTAETEAGEFHDIYRLGAMVIPTHRPCVREDLNDLMFKGRRQKFNRVLEDLVQANKKGQPVLIGTASVESSEVFSRMLKLLTFAYRPECKILLKEKLKLLHRLDKRSSDDRNEYGRPGN